MNHQDQDQDLIQDLSGPMTKGRTRKAQETLQHKVTHLDAQLKISHLDETKLITCIACLEC